MSNPAPDFLIHTPPAAGSIGGMAQALGAASEYWDVGAALTATTTNTFQPISQQLSKGVVGFRVLVANAATTVAVKITVDDGTTTYVVASYPASDAGDLFEYVFAFSVPIKIVNINIIATLGGIATTCTYNAEFCLGF